MNLQLRLYETLVVIFLAAVLFGGGVIAGLNLSLRQEQQTKTIIQKVAATERIQIEAGGIKVDPLLIKLDSKPLEIVIKNEKGKILARRILEIDTTIEPDDEVVEEGKVKESIVGEAVVPNSREALDDADIQRTTKPLPGVEK